MKKLIKNILFLLGWKMVKNNCVHGKKEIVFEDYPERCTHYFCKDCLSKVYEGWD